jgi:hypothetical protein
MANEHSWTECRPALLALPGARPAPDGAALALAWSLVPEQDRQLFHEFCCLNRRDPLALAAVSRISDVLHPLLQQPGLEL